MVLSKNPTDMEKVSKELQGREAMRLSLIAELDAISLYEQMAESVEDEDAAKVLRDVAKEEKTHVGEFLTVLLQLDSEQQVELTEGEEEVEVLLRWGPDL